MDQQSQVDKAVAEGGAYEVIRARLEEQASQLKSKVHDLNHARIAEFGQAKLDVAGRVRVRTENNCIARDIVPVGESLLFGYNVFIGLKKETQIEDVFSLYRLIKKDAGFELEIQALSGTFLDDPNFVREFNELYVYYKEAKLIQLKVQGQTLFAVFQIGRKIEDIRVFQWRVNKDGSASYIDNRGERAIKKANSHDFEWLQAKREQHETGSYPHINILDKVFVETINGQLTIKVENNTEDGLGIYNEPVDDKTQSLADAEVLYAEVGVLILLKIQPYREKHYRYLVFNTRTQSVDRIDAIGSACITLPEDHGIIFPGGYYLQNGETKSFPDDIEGLQFKRNIRSPNGEDVLYVFYEPESGLSGLYSYNLIRKTLQNPIYAHGYSIFEDGTAVIFNAESEATRIHPMQIWETPFFSDEFAANTPTEDNFFTRIGNKELVRGISDLSAIVKTVADPTPSRNLYEDLVKSCSSLFDSYHWLEEPEVNGMDQVIRQLTSTSELVIDEFDKVEQIRKQAYEALSQAETKQQEIIASLRPSDWQSPEPFVEALTELRKQKGHLITLREQRYIDLKRIEQLDDEVSQHSDSISSVTVEFLSSEQAMGPYLDKISTIEAKLPEIELAVELTPVAEELEKLSEGLDVLTDVLNGLKVEDATVRTKILDDISEIYAKLNQVKAHARKHKKALGSGEATAEFAAQFRLFSQSINNALSMADTPEKADDSLARLMIQLEELESKFSEYDQFLEDIITQREELHNAFESRKQALLEEQQRKAQNMYSAAQRILSGINRRAQSFTEIDQLNTYFASDPMAMKIADLVEQLREQNDQVKADDLEAQLKSAREQGIRSLRDKQDIFEDGGAIIKLGKHKFSVNSQSLDLTLLPKAEGLFRHLVGTDYFEQVDNEELNTLKPYWQQNLISENDTVSRLEYLCYIILQDAENNRNSLSIDKLGQLIESPSELKKVVHTYMTQRYQEGYEKGIHDADVISLLTAVFPVHQTSGLLRFAPEVRSLAMLFWQFSDYDKQQRQVWQSHAISAQLLAKTFNSPSGFSELTDNLCNALDAFCLEFNLQFSANTIEQSAQYLSLELAEKDLSFVTSEAASKVVNSFTEALGKLGHEGDFNQALQRLSDITTGNKGGNAQSKGLKEQLSLTMSWLEAMLNTQEQDKQLLHYLSEATALIICNSTLPVRNSKVTLSIKVEGILSEHKNIEDGTLTFALDEFNQRVGQFAFNDVPNFTRYHRLKHDITELSKQQLQLDAYSAKPLSSFVRNRLIDEVYLPIIGNNLAKQMGTVGDNKRTDLMGLLLLISPPGYGKTTLMEYIADRLGLVFMKINCPSLGHDVTSIDPSNAPNATARQELEKLNLGLEMGNNVMLYLDDIQHTHPEFLQKFIALCDGTRRIEGVWKGNSKTYDMRGKKFCVVMAGNPYTESGDVFKIPDMLANRADIYNLGDVLGGKEEQFALSYIENCLTSSPVLAPLALRDMEDVYKLIGMAQGKDIATTDLNHQYSGAELNEIKAVLKHLFAIQDVILKVNLQYIQSAATAEDYRQEPPFKLQGSYRNMNKMAEKVSAVMNHDELMQLIADHYVGEAQTLTSGAEENLLKLAMLRDNASDEQRHRWEQICASFTSKQVKNLEGDPAQLAVQQLSHIAKSLDELKTDAQLSQTDDLIRPINRVAAAMQLLSKTWAGADTGNGAKSDTDKNEA